MSDLKISALTNYTTPISGDVLPINDTTNTTTKKVTTDNLFNMLASLFRVKDSSDPTKKVAFDVSGVTTATTRTLTIPNASTTIVGTDATQTLTNKTLTAPTMADFTNANHDHQDADDGGTLAEAALALTDITTNNSTTSKHGFLPKLSNVASQFLDGTGAFSTPSSGGSVLTLMPRPNFPQSGVIVTRAINTNTTAFAAQIVVPFTIVVNKLSMRTGTVNAAGTAKIALFSEDGQTQKISITTASLDTSNTVYTTAVSAVSLSPGIYYLVILPVSTTDTDVIVYANLAAAGGELAGTIASEPVINGTITVTASTMPATITPGSITNGTTTDYALVIRLDN